MKINAYQSVMIHGWWAQPRLTLAWEDVKHKNISWRQLRDLGFEPVDLKRIQPDKMEWIQRGGLQLHDLVDMMVFPVNPLTDYRADLAELWNLKCSHAQLLQMGVTFEQLVKRGLNAQIMYYFDFSLSEWVDLGMTKKDVLSMTDAECQTVFAVDKNELMQIFDEFVSSSKYAAPTDSES
jgi:hypothetical protein